MSCIHIFDLKCKDIKNIEGIPWQWLGLCAVIALRVWVQFLVRRLRSCKSFDMAKKVVDTSVQMSSNKLKLNYTSTSRDLGPLFKTWWRQGVVKIFFNLFASDKGK